MHPSRVLLTQVASADRTKIKVGAAGAATVVVERKTIMLSHNMLFIVKVFCGKGDWKDFLLKVLQEV